MFNGVTVILGPRRAGRWTRTRGCRRGEELTAGIAQVECTTSANGLRLGRERIRGCHCCSGSGLI